MLFTGTSSHTIDAKGRIVLPARFRAQLGETFYVTKGFYDCVQVLSAEEFEKLRENIKALPAQLALALQYAVISTAVEVSPNSQGRIPIPQTLREEAGLDKNVSVVGMDNRLEIWDEDKLAQFKLKNKPNLTEALNLLKM